MKRILTFLLCLGLVQCANSAILFYKQNLSVRVSGGGQSITRKYIGYTLIDSATGAMVFVPADVKTKLFWVDQPDYTLATVHNTTLDTETILQIKSGSGEGLNATGIDTGLTVGPLLAPVLGPKTLTVSGMATFIPGGLTSYYNFEYHGSLVYDKLTTASQAGREAGRDLSASINVVRQILVDMRYTER